MTSLSILIGRPHSRWVSPGSLLVASKPILEPINNSVESIVQLMHDKSTTQEAKTRIPNLIMNEESSNSVQEAQ